MAILYIGAGINHFLNPDFYLPMMPPYIPAPSTMILLSGVIEVLLGVGLWVPKTRSFAAWAIIAMLFAFMPVHIHMLVNAEQYSDIPVAVLWARLPLQALFVAWAYWHTKKG
jgi:uncharacterized membrane protein